MSATLKLSRRRSPGAHTRSPRSATAVETGIVVPQPGKTKEDQGTVIRVHTPAGAVNV